jgi:putative methionine-R-sulfoxide reductase with GAF domain
MHDDSGAAFATELRRALTLAATTGTLAAPLSHARLLELIVETAARVIGANAGALFLIDRDAGELIFEVAIGPKSAEVKPMRVPLGHGIAGLVAVSGQPMAVADASRDPRQAADIAQRVSYLPESILCVPLLYQDEVIGVLELLDKQGAPAFSAGDLSVLGHFAQQAAVAIEQSRLQHNLTALLVGALAALDALPAERAGRLEQRARELAATIEADPTHQRSLELARIVQRVAARGEAEADACRAPSGPGVAVTVAACASPCWTAASTPGIRPSAPSPATSRWSRLLLASPMTQPPTTTSTATAPPAPGSSARWRRAASCTACGCSARTSPAGASSSRPACAGRLSRACRSAT